MDLSIDWYSKEHNSLETNAVSKVCSLEYRMIDKVQQLSIPKIFFNYPYFFQLFMHLVPFINLDIQELTVFDFNIDDMLCMKFLIDVKNVYYPKIEIVIFLLNGRLISIKFDVTMTLS